MHCQIQPAHGGLALSGIGQCDRQISAQTHQYLGLTRCNGLHGGNRVMSVRARRLETVSALDALQERCARPFGDTDAAIALHVRVTPQRADARAGFAEVAAQEQEVGNLLDVGGAGHVLHDAHAVRDDGGVCPGIGRRHAFERGAIEPARRLDRGPRLGSNVVSQGRETVGVRGDELMVEHVRLTAADAVHGDQGLDDSRERRAVAAHLELVIAGGDLGGTQGGHFDRILRIGKTFERSFAQRVEDDDGNAPARAFVQCAHHARVIGAGVVAHRDDEVARIEIIEGHRALADADGQGQPDAGRFMTHVRTIGKIVRAELTGEQLIQKRRFVRRTTRSVEFGHVRIGEGSQHRPDPRECGVPGDRCVTVLRRVVGHGMSHAAFALQLVVGPLQQFGHGVSGEKLRRYAPAGRLPRHCLRAVLAKLKSRGVVLVGPGTAGAIEPVRLVGTEQQQRCVGNAHLIADRLGGGAKRTPSACWTIVRPDAGHIASLHRGVNSASNALAPYTLSNASRMMAGCRATARFLAGSNQ